MSIIHSEKKFRSIALMVLIYYIILITPAAAIGEASTSLYVFVPPGGSSGSSNTSYQTSSYLVVTATQNNTFINITDLDRTIGDPTNKSIPFINLTAYPISNASDYDLSETIILNKGQSRTIKVSYGENGPDKDGTYFHIESNKPVIALSTTNQGTFQADFVPSISGTNKGCEFFVYLPSDYSDELDKGYDLAVFAYENDTNVTVYDISLDTTEMDRITDYNLTTSVKISYDNIVESEVLGETNPELFLEAADNSGVHGGHTYWVVASKPVTVQSAGTIGRDTHEARDGGYFIPGYSTNPYRDGTGLASTFIAQLNLYGEVKGETELYLVNQNTSNTAYVFIEEWNGNSWKSILGSPFTVGRSEMIIINEEINNLFHGTGLVRIFSQDDEFYRSPSCKPIDISVFATSWLEVSGSPTADISAFATGDTGYGGSKETIVYVPPPGKEPFYSIDGSDIRYSHIYIYNHFNNNDIQVQAWNNLADNWMTLPNGIYNGLEKDIVIDHRITLDQWENSPDNIDYHKIRVLSTERTTVQVNNWNDNWACYIPGGTPPEFSATISVQNRYLTINSIPVPRISYSFDITNGIIGNIGSDLYNLSVVNAVPDEINSEDIHWSVSSSEGRFEYGSTSSVSPDCFNGTKLYTWNLGDGFDIYAHVYNDSRGMVFTYNKYIIEKGEVLTFTISSPLNATYYNGTPILAGPVVIDVSAEAENPFLGDLSTYAKLPGTIILNYLSPGSIELY